MPKSFLGEPFCAVFQKTSGSEKVYGEEGGGEYQDFPSKNFRLTLAEKFVGEPFSKSAVSGVEKIYASDGYVTIFYPNFFVSQYRNVS